MYSHSTTYATQQCRLPMPGCTIFIAHKLQSYSVTTQLVSQLLQHASLDTHLLPVLFESAYTLHEIGYMSCMLYQSVIHVHVYIRIYIFIVFSDCNYNCNIAIYKCTIQIKVYAKVIVLSYQLLEIVIVVFMSFMVMYL